MATQSILKNISIENEENIEIFVSAIEQASEFSEHKEKFEIESSDLSKNELNDYFEKIMQNA